MDETFTSVLYDMKSFVNSVNISRSFARVALHRFRVSIYPETNILILSVDTTFDYHSYKQSQFRQISEMDPHEPQTERLSDLNFQNSLRRLCNNLRPKSKIIIQLVTGQPVTCDCQ